MVGVPAGGLLLLAPLRPLSCIGRPQRHSSCWGSSRSSLHVLTPSRAGTPWDPLAEGIDACVPAVEGSAAINALLKARGTGAAHHLTFLAALRHCELEGGLLLAAFPRSGLGGGLASLC
jgi:hypothetical protein